MDEQSQYALMRLIIAWALVGAVIFTVLLVLLSLVGWVKFANKKQQNKLFHIIVVELAAGCVAQFLGWIEISPRKAKMTVEKPLVEENQTFQSEIREMSAESERTFLNAVKNIAKQEDIPVSNKSFLFGMILKGAKPNEIPNSSAEEVLRVYAISPPKTRRNMENALGYVQEKITLRAY